MGQPPRWAVAGLFVDSLGRRDFGAMAGCLAPGVVLRGLTPRQQIEVVGPDEVVARFDRWFAGPERFEVLDATIGELGPRLYLRWRVAMTSPASTRIVEQHLFATVAGRIVRLDLLCSGFTSPLKGSS